MSSVDRLEIKLTAAVAPIETNGQWNEEEKQVTWKSSLEIPGEPVSKLLPTFCYARWAYPNEEFQKAHFGRVVLTGKNLAQYVDWRMSLTESEGAEWDRFLAGIVPDRPVVSQVALFTFQTSDSSAEVRQLLTVQLREIFDAVVTEPD